MTELQYLREEAVKSKDKSRQMMSFTWLCFDPFLKINSHQELHFPPHMNFMSVLLTRAETVSILHHSCLLYQTHLHAWFQWLRRNRDPHTDSKTLTNPEERSCAPVSVSFFFLLALEPRLQVKPQNGYLRSLKSGSDPLWKATLYLRWWTNYSQLPDKSWMDIWFKKKKIMERERYLFFKWHKIRPKIQNWIISLKANK